MQKSLQKSVIFDLTTKMIIMARFKKILDTRNKKADKFPVKIAISHKSKTRYISTGYKVSIKDWDENKEKIKSSFENSTRANKSINKKYTVVEDVIDMLTGHLDHLDVDQIKEAAELKIKETLEGKMESTASSVDAILSGRISTDNTCFFEYCNKMVAKFYEDDRGGSASTIKDTMKSLKAFTSKTKLPFVDIDQDFLEKYDKWYLSKFNSRGKKNTINGLGFRMREIRRLYNLAIKDKSNRLSNEYYPFGRNGYTIRKEKTMNRDLTEDEMAKIMNLQLTKGTKLWHHLNYWKFCFECWGMNFADVAFLRVYQIDEGVLKYRRRKTKWTADAKPFDIQLSDVALDILDYYIQGKKPNDVVFPILEDILDCKDNELIHKKYKDRRSNHIRRLKTIAKKAGVESNISTYVGRHSFFSIALKNGVPKAEISELAGHEGSQTTETYLSGFKKEHLADNAKLVRQAVSRHINKPQESVLLSEKIVLKDNGKKVSVEEFLNSLKSTNDHLTGTDIVVAMLTETNCNDGSIAQQYADEFITITST